MLVPAPMLRPDAVPPATSRPSGLLLSTVRIGTLVLTPFESGFYNACVGI
jgi:hypothetical protein